MTQPLWKFLATAFLLALLGPGVADAAPTTAAVTEPSTAAGAVTPAERLRELLTRLDRANQVVLEQHEASGQRSRYTILLKEAVRGKRISAATWQKVLQETNRREKEAIEQLARRFRADVYRNFRSRRAVFTQRRAAWSRVFAAWEAADSPFLQQGELIEWLNSAIAASTPGTLGAMPHDPTFAPMAELPSPEQIARQPDVQPTKRAVTATILPARDLQEMLLRSFATGIDVPPEPPPYVTPDPSSSGHLAKIDSVRSDDISGNILPRETILLATVDSRRMFPEPEPVLDSPPIDRIVPTAGRSTGRLPLVATFPVPTIIPESVSDPAKEPSPPLHVVPDRPVAQTTPDLIGQPTVVQTPPQLPSRPVPVAVVPRQEPIRADNAIQRSAPISAIAENRGDPTPSFIVDSPASMSVPSDAADELPMLIMADPFAQPSLAVLSSQSPTVPPTALMALRDSPGVMPQMSQPTSVPLGPLPAGVPDAMRSGVPEEASHAMVNLDELSARIAGSNLATLALEADLGDEDRRRSARELAQIIKRLDRVMVRQKDLGMLRELLPQGQRDRTSRLTSPGSLISQAAGRIHEARTYTSSPDFRGNESHRLAELQLLDELSRQLVRVASDGS